MSKLSRLYYVIRFDKRFLRRFVLLLVIACLLVVVAQLAYPSSRALPGTRIAGSTLAFEDDTHVVGALHKLDQDKFELELANKGYQATPKVAGLTFADPDDVDSVLNYPFKQRLIPFSIFFQHKAAVQSHLRASINIGAADKFASKLAAEGNTQPIEGAVTVNNGVVTTHPPQPGIRFNNTDIINAIKDLPGTIPQQIAVSGQHVPSVYSETAVQAAAERAKQLMQPVTATINGKSFNVSAVTVGSWLTFTPNSTTKSLDVGFNNAAIKTYLDGLASQFYQAPKPVTATLLDNVVVSQQGGPAGAYLNTTSGAATVASALTNNQPSVTIDLSQIPPPTSYIHTYSATSRGLQTLLNDWVSAHRGPTWGIGIAEIGGKGRVASYNGSGSFLSASIYKLYVTYSAQNRIADGKLDQNAMTSTGKSVATCLDLMIVDSDNACAVAIGNMVGWNNITNEAHAAGFTSTNVEPRNEYTTANNTALFLEKLASGSLMNASQTSTLLNRMEHQIYRSGLPAGSKGATVADKVGFIYDYMHDAGIIYYPGRTYVISVFSDGGSWSQIASLAGTIGNYMATH